MQLALLMHFISGCELVVVDAQHAGQVRRVLGRGAEDDALRAGREMGVVAGLAFASPGP